MSDGKIANGLLRDVKRLEREFNALRKVRDEMDRKMMAFAVHLGALQEKVKYPFRHADEGERHP